MTEKIVNFCVQLLIILHYFSNLILIIVMIKNNNIDLIVEADIITIKLIEKAAEKNDNFNTLLLTI